MAMSEEGATGAEHSRTADVSSHFSLLRWTVLGCVLLALVGMLCIVLSGWMIRGVEALWGGPAQAETMGTTGQYFDAVGAMFSGFALTLAIVATLLQRRELREQRGELALQRRAQEEQNKHLRMSAEAELRNLHVDLLRMSLHDDSLAEFWESPGYDTPEHRRQFLYANLVYSHFFLHFKLGLRSYEEMIGHIQSDLCRSSVFRAYWQASRRGKEVLKPGSA
jgi:hypothetical protein